MVNFHNVTLPFTMILSAYRNPPYRSPAPKSPTHPDRSSAHHAQGPRRDLTSDETDFTLHASERHDAQRAHPDAFHISSRHDSERFRTRADSPRCAVAEWFRHLDLGHSDLSENEYTLSPRKRKRTRDMSPQSPEVPESGSESGGVMDVPLKRQHHRDALALRLKRENHSTLSTKQYHNDSDDLESSVITLTSNQRFSSDLSNPGESHLTHKRDHMSEAKPASLLQDVVDRATSPGHSHRIEDEDSAIRAALTWQDDEITGYDIDPDIPDDDGEGINGIGFRPTAAIAYARSQKRRQQLHEWRLREAREARQKRMDRRRGANPLATSRMGVNKRMVRFDPGSD